MKHRQHFLFTLFFIFFSSSFAWGVMFKSLTLSQMVAIAPRILLFTVTDQRLEYDQYESKLYVNYVSGNVAEWIKGAGADTLTFKQIADVKDDNWDGTQASMRHNLPQYTTGQTYLLFLAGDSEIGMASPIGGAQGVIPVQKENGEWVLSGQTKALSKAQLGLGTTKTTKNRYEDLKSVIKTLLEE